MQGVGEMKRWKCYRCTMSFRIGKPDGRPSDDAITRCECGQRFWHVRPDQGKAKVGIFPEDLPEGVEA